MDEGFLIVGQVGGLFERQPEPLYRRVCLPPPREHAPACFRKSGGGLCEEEVASAGFGFVGAELLHNAEAVTAGLQLRNALRREARHAVLRENRSRGREDLRIANRELERLRDKHHPVSHRVHHHGLRRRLQ